MGKQKTTGGATFTRLYPPTQRELQACAAAAEADQSRVRAACATGQKKTRIQPGLPSQPILSSTPYDQHLDTEPACDDEEPPEYSEQTYTGIGLVYPGPSQRTYQKQRAGELRNWRMTHSVLQTVTPPLLPGLTAAVGGKHSRVFEELEALVQHYIAHPVHVSEQQQPSHVSPDPNTKTLCSGPATVLSYREVEYRSLQVCTSIQLPTFECSCCKSTFEIPTTALLAYGSAPLQPGFLYDQALCGLAVQLRDTAGVSLTAFCQAINALHLMDKRLFGSQLDSNSAQRWFQPIMDDKSFADAVQCYAVVTASVCDPASYGITDYRAGAFGDCSACAGHLLGLQPDTILSMHQLRAFDTQMSVEGQSMGHFTTASSPSHDTHQPAAHGPPLPPPLDLQAGNGLPPCSTEARGFAGNVLRHALHAVAAGPPGRALGVNLDANRKHNHYGFAGKTTTQAYEQLQLPPLSSRYFGSVHDRLPTLLPTLEQLGKRGGSDVGDCDANLTCARPVDQQGNAIEDHKCIVGSVCAAHGVPIQNGFLSSTSNEQYALYYMLLYALTDEVKELQHVVIDFACQLQGSFERQLPRLAERMDLKWFVGWLHSSAGHNLKCQLKYSSMYADGTGRLIGELIEQAWSFMKDKAPICRYMALPHRRDMLDAAVKHFADLKYKGLPALLSKAFRHAQERLVDLQRQLYEIQQHAAQQQIDLEPGRPSLAADVQTVQFDEWMRYVRLLCQLQLVSNMSSAGSMRVVLAETATAKASLAQLGDPQYVRRLHTRLGQLRIKLGLEEDLDCDDERFKEQCQRLRDAEIRSHQLQIERKVAALATLQKERSGEVAGRTSRSLLKRLQRHRSQIRQLLRQWQAWHGFMRGGEAEEDAPSYVESDVFSNKFPWDASGVAGTREYLQLRHHAVTCEIARTKEELVFLPVDAHRSLITYAHHFLQINQAMYTTAMQLCECPGSIANQGKQHMLRSLCMEAYAMLTTAANEFTSGGLLA